MSIYITTDTHFNHRVMEWKCKRPEDFEKRIVNEFDKLDICDTLIHLGDVCVGKDQEVHTEIINPILSRKILIIGSHDHKSYEWYLNNGWDWVCESMVLYHKDKFVLFSHEPQDCDYDLNIHGHMHNWRDYKPKPNQKLLALEDNDYKLWKLDCLL